MSIWSQIQLFAAQAVPPNIIDQDLDNKTVQNVFNIVLGLAGAVAVAFVVFGGVKYMLSQGEPQQTKQARDTILYAVIGIVVVAAAFFLINFVIGQF